MQQLTPRQRILLAARAILDTKTVARVYRGAGSDNSRERAREAAQALGFPLPPDPQPDVAPQPERAA